MATAYPHESQAWKVIVSTAVGFALATIGIAVRFYCRWLMRKRLEANDYLILAAYIPKLGIDIASILLITFGIGQHITALSQTQITNYLKTEYVGSFLYAPCVGLIKLSILSLYMSAFPARYMKVCVWIIGAIVTAWAIACCLVGLLACIPINAVWDLSVKGSCINTYSYYFGLQIPNIVTDFAILALPWKAIFDMRLDRSSTIALSSVVMLGLLTCIFDIIRLVVLVQTPQTLDFSWNQVPASVWTDLEPSVAMLAACLPMWRPLLHFNHFWRERQVSTSLVDDGAEYDMDNQQHKSQFEAHSRDFSSGSD